MHGAQLSNDPPQQVTAQSPYTLPPPTVPATAGPAPARPAGVVVGLLVPVGGPVGGRPGGVAFARRPSARTRRGACAAREGDEGAGEGGGPRRAGRQAGQGGGPGRLAP